MSTPTLPILEAVNELLEEIRKNHPEVPPVTVVLGAKGTTRRGITHGHFAPESWVGEAVHEIMLSGESLARGAEPTLGTLIHEAAHARAHAAGIKDTSNHGRYHNKKFKELGESMGIVLDQAPTLGWSLTTLAEGTADKYREGLDKLASVLTAYKKGPGLKAGADPDKPKNKTKGKMDCDCGDPVSVSLQWFERKGQSLQCDDCLSGFKLIEED